MTQFWRELLTFVSSSTLAPNGPEKWGCRMRIRTYLVKFEPYLIKFETYSVLRDYETEKTTSAPAPAAPASLAPMTIWDIS